MKPTVIICIRGCHMDDLPSELVRNGIEFAKSKYPVLPITFCYEADPKLTLKFCEESLEKKALTNNTRDPRNSYSPVEIIGETQHDKSLAALFKMIQQSNINHAFTDMPGINDIPQGKIGPYKETRENHMAKKLLEIAEKTGGIIFDLGGDNHIPGIQRYLMKKNDLKNIETHFFCVYSDQVQEQFPPTLRMQQFLGISQETYPLGLAFKTTVRENDKEATSLLSTVEKQYREKLYKNFQTEILIPAFQKLTKQIEQTQQLNTNHSNSGSSLLMSQAATALSNNNKLSSSPVTSSSSAPSSATKKTEITTKDLNAALKKCQTKSDNGTLPSIALALRRAVVGVSTQELTIDIFKILLANATESDINEAGASSGQTPLHLAVIYKNVDMLQLLLSKNAKKDLLDTPKEPHTTGKTALDYAKESENSEIRKLFDVKVAELN